MRHMRKLLALVLLAAAVVALPAYASAIESGYDPMKDAGPEPDSYICCPPLDGGVELSLDQSAAGRGGNHFIAGDVLVLTAQVRNWNDGPVSGILSFDIPWARDCDVIAAPCLERVGTEGFNYKLEIPDAGMRASAALVLTVPFKPDPVDWTASASFTVQGPGEDEETTVTQEVPGYYGTPSVHIDKDALYRDGIIKIWNFGSGTAYDVKFRFLAKEPYQNGDGLSDGMRYIGEGRIEVDLGDIACNDFVLQDVSGLLHMKMDRDGPIEIACDGGFVAE